ncbi:nitrite reductase (NAD(P)H) small subunit [Bacillus sp. FJAT-27251]|uniref:nitrite reductase (NAD(P)H) small subunit n=1 Tax=Bacillus sp. FJAT-27251 TaxID=1684142 RepID=UPI0006A7A4B4|nr:nitrite reductase (NAD(P)H) small subunit [Bacillus sp. FJAT-27251]
MTRYYLTDYDLLPERTGQVFEVEGEEVALFRLSTGAVAAVENRSPHPKGGTLGEGLVSGHYVYCPVYDWKISLLDGKVQSPDEGQAKIFQVERDGEQVFIVK